MKNPIRIYSIVINNLGSNFGGGNPLAKGSLNVITDRDPSFIYERIGNFFMAQEDGFVHCYQYVPGSKDGFGGREICLRVRGGTVFKKLGYHAEKFKGSLWDTAAAYRAFEERFHTKLYHAAQASDAGYRKCPVFCSCYVTQGRFKEIAQNLILKQQEEFA